ncbi:Probable phage associated protein [Candidatus Phytoplasma australiense]|uniref:Probable phage associated protein n=1 Tax=Phytoplasma australiense TaxID=59748 RepID=B1V8Y6_PHYAS|nr:Probable phage associated protein [Candidatus Phytoplasma australiense]
MNNNHQPQILQKYWQYFLGVLLTVLFIYHYQFVFANSEDKSTDITTITTNLGVFENIPEDTEICQRIKELHSEFKNKQIKKNCDIQIQIKSVEVDGQLLEYEGIAYIVAKENSKTIKGKKALTFYIKQDLGKCIQNKDLGEVELKKINAKVPEIQDLKEIIAKINPELDLDEVEILEKRLERNKFTLKAKENSLKYKGKAEFNYKIKEIVKKEIGEKIVEKILHEKKNATSSDNQESRKEINFEDLKKTINIAVEKEMKRKEATEESVLNKGLEAAGLKTQHPENQEEEELIAPNNDVDENIQHISDELNSEETPALTSKTIKDKITQNKTYIVYIIAACIICFLFVIFSIFFISCKKTKKIIKA